MTQRSGVEVVVVPNDDHGQLDTTALASLIDERTRLVGVSHVPTAGGLVNPAAEIGKIASDAGVLYLLDATQSVGQFPVTATETGADMITATGRKFLRGPRGTGFLWVGQSALDRLDPHVAEIRSATWDGDRGFTWVPGARRFETWENSYLNLLGLGSAVQQALELSMDAIGERTHALGQRLRDGLDQLSGVRTHDLGEHRCAIVTASVDNLETDRVAELLVKQHINVSTTVPEHNQFDTEERHVHPLVRLSPHYYNTEAEIDQTIAALADIAAMPRS